MARLNKNQIYAILWLNNQKKTVDEICTELSLTNKQVVGVIEKNQSTNNSTQTNPIKTVSESVSKTGSKNLMITHTRDKKTNNVAVMTKEASMLNDELRKNFPQNRSNEKAIFRPNDK